MDKYLRIYAAIDLNAIYSNIAQVKKRVGNSVKIMPVIKADGYGHGAVPIAEKLKDLADYYAIAVIDEAEQLRNAGITKPLLILGTLSPQQYVAAVENDVTIAMYSYEAAKKLSSVAVRLGKTAKIHFALDTGMNRIGFDCSDNSIQMAGKIAALPNILAEGIFTHYATADESDKTHALQQLTRFDDFCTRLSQSGVHVSIRHICNSAGITDLTQHTYDMVRPGIITYGLNPSDETDKTALDLKPAMQLKTHISHLKTVEAGEGISYGRTYITDTKRRIATVPVGYADGYPRSLSNRGRVIIHGKYAPIVGRVCMDQFMVDVTEIENVCVDDCVTLIGTEQNACISVDEIATLAGTINYEIVCGISKRVPRIYQ